MLEDVSMLYNILIMCHYFLTNGQMKTLPVQLWMNPKPKNGRHNPTQQLTTANLIIKTWSRRWKLSLSLKWISVSKFYIPKTDGKIDWNCSKELNKCKISRRETKYSGINSDYSRSNLRIITQCCRLLPPHMGLIPGSCCALSLS